MRGRYQRRLTPREWWTQLAAYAFTGFMILMCFLCVAGYGYLHM